MTVTVDADAEALMAFMENPEPAFKEVIDLANDEIRGPHGIMRKRFERKAGTQRTYEPLKPETLRRKKKKKQKNILVASGRTKGITLKTMKGSLKGNKIEFDASVNKYSEYVNEKRRFFSMDGKDGKPMRQDEKELDMSFKRSFVKVMRTVRVRYKP